MRAEASQRVERLVEEGKLDEAIGALYDALRHDKLDPELNERMHQLLLQKEDPARALKQGPAYLKSLTAARRGPQALVALQRLRALDARFEAPAECVVPMAKAAVRARDYRTAIHLLQGFDKRNPGHADIPGAYLLTARIAREHLHRDDRAMAILEALLKRYPASPLADEAVKYLASLTAVAQGKPWFEIAI